MAAQTKIYNDKIDENLDEKETRKETLEGILERADCDDQEAFEFCNC